MAWLGGLGAGVLSISLAGALGCTSLAPSSAKGSGETGDGAAYRIAVAPVTLAPELERQAADDPARYTEASIHVGHYLAEALLERGYEVVPARDSAGILSELTRSSDLHRDASELARVAIERLGVDALLVVELTRWAPRDTHAITPPGPAPDPASSSRVPPLLPDPREGAGSPPSPAAVGFRATLHGGPRGLLLWSGEFSERQASFFESPWRSLRYPGRGTRRLSVTELARWGAGRLAAQIPLVPGPVERP